MASNTSKLFQPIKVGTNQLQHRIVMPPMTRVRAPNAVPTHLMAEYYAQRASTPGTLLITEATYVSERAGGMPGTPGIWNQEQIDAWKKVTDAVHAKNSFIWVQIWALGRAAHPDWLKANNFPYVSASDIQHPDRSEPPRPLAVSEIKEYVADFGSAARNALAAGFDGVEIHGANGYLVDQFLSTNTNKRTDDYGGSIENRIRFALEIVDAVVGAVGAERTAIRLSPWGAYQHMCMPNPIPTFEGLVKRIDEKHPNLAYLSVVEPDEYGLGFATDKRGPKADPDVVRSNDFVDAIRLPRPVLHSNGLTLAMALEKVEKEGVLIGLARSFIANPDLPERLRTGVERAKADHKTYYGGGEVGYTDYPFATAVTAKA